MKEKSMDKFLEDLCSSEKEREELQEIASLISSMQGEQPSSSFQARLKEELMEQASRQAAGNTNNSTSEHKPRFYWKRFRPMYAVATAAAVILAFLVLFTDALPPWGSSTADPDKPPSERIISIRNFTRIPDISRAEETEEIDILEKDPETEKDVSDNITENDQKSTEEKTSREQGEQDAVVHDRDQTSGEQVGDAEKTSKEDEPEPTDETDKLDEVDKPQTEPEEEPDPLTPEPDFDIWEKEQSVRVAGVVDLPEIKYGNKAIDEQEPVGSIEYSWRPGMIVEASVKTSEIGTTQWARKLLADEGFTVGTNDSLEITQQKTQKGTFVEIVLTPGRSTVLPMVVYYHEDRGIIGYYYEEKGSVLQAGYYPILSPSRAFEQIKDVPVYSEHKRLVFSFRKVSLEYHEFIIVRNGEQQSTRLPAYRFTGMEINRGGAEIDIYLPAVRIP